MYKPLPYFENDTKTSIVKYQFVTPLHLNVKRLDGLTILTGFGIGDIIEVLEPSMQSLACNWEPWIAIPLADGSILLDPDNKLTNVTRVM